MDNNATIRNQILQDFKLYNNIQSLDKLENTIKLYINKAIQEILNLTNRIYFPLELKYVILDMINDFYTINASKFSNINKEEENNIDDSYIKSLSEAGRSVTFESTSQLVLNSLLSSHIASELENRKKQIYRYRLLYKEHLRKEDTVENY